MGENSGAESPLVMAKTSVWWDIENCAVPRDCNPNAIAQNISSALVKMNYCGPVSISAYGDTNQINCAVRQALSSTGIGLHHVPAGVKDASDKKILVDMLFWAMENPAPANYLLISGDRDFSNAIHQLRMRRYNILLAQPPNASAPLIAAAKSVWLWTSLVAGGLPLSYGEAIKLDQKKNVPNSVNSYSTNMVYKLQNTHPGSHAKLKNRFPGGPEDAQGLTGVILLALNTLRSEKMKATEENISDCIRYGDLKHWNTDIKKALDSAVEQNMITRYSSGAGPLYVGKKQHPWKSVNFPTDKYIPYTKATWNAIQKFLASPAGRSAILSSRSRYEAAAMLKSVCLKELPLGNVVHVLTMAITFRKWIINHESGWQPLTITIPEENVDFGSAIVGAKATVTPSPTPSIQTSKRNFTEEVSAPNKKNKLSQEESIAPCEETKEIQKKNFANLPATMPITVMPPGSAEGSRGTPPCVISATEIAISLTQLPQPNPTPLLVKSEAADSFSVSPAATPAVNVVDKHLLASCLRGDSAESFSPVANPSIVPAQGTSTIHEIEASDVDGDFFDRIMVIAPLLLPPPVPEKLEPSQEAEFLEALNRLMALASQVPCFLESDSLIKQFQDGLNFISKHPSKSNLDKIKLVDEMKEIFRCIRPDMTGFLEHSSTISTLKQEVDDGQTVLDKLSIEGKAKVAAKKTVCSEIARLEARLQQLREEESALSIAIQSLKNQGMTENLRVSTSWQKLNDKEADLPVLRIKRDQGIESLRKFFKSMFPQLDQ